MSGVQGCKAAIRSAAACRSSHAVLHASLDTEARRQLACTRLERGRGEAAAGLDGVLGQRCQLSQGAQAAEGRHGGD